MNIKYLHNKFVAIYVESLIKLRIFVHTNYTVSLQIVNINCLTVLIKNALLFTSRPHLNARSTLSTYA